MFIENGTTKYPKAPAGRHVLKRMIREELFNAMTQQGRCI